MSSIERDDRANSSAGSVEHRLEGFVDIVAFEGANGPLYALLCLYCFSPGIVCSVRCAWVRAVDCRRMMSGAGKFERSKDYRLAVAFVICVKYVVPTQRIQFPVFPVCKRDGR